jgi:membrane protein involved in colicin uptake
MKASQDYSEVVARAEKAVASVKDPELKKIAFQKVLDDLLGSSSEAKHTNIRSTKRPREARKTSGGATSKAGPKAYIEDLIEDGFFKKPKPISEVKTALENLGHHIPVTSLSGPLQKLCQQKRLRRQKHTESGTYTYSEW